MSCVHIYIYIHTVVTYTYLPIYYIYSTIFTQFHTHIASHSIQDTVDSATHDLCSLPGLPASYLQLRHYHRAEPPQHHLYLGQHCRTNTCGAQRFPGFPEKSPWFRWIKMGSFRCLALFGEPGVFNQAAFRSWTLIHVASGFFSDLWDEGSMRYIIMTWCRDSTFKQQFMDAESLPNLPP
jgi:hypothetical protein